VPRSRQLFGGLASLAAAAALPLILWHHAIQLVATDFRLDWDYLLTGWTGYGLIAVGLLLMTPVVVGRPRAAKAYMGWGVSLYLLGAVLAAQVAMAI
jgi:hypothetical protein